MSSFEPNKRHLRELLIYFFNLKKSAAETHRLLVEAYGDAALSERSCREWFKNGEFDVEDKERSGKPKLYEDAELESIIGWRFMPNAKSICTYIRSDSTNNFISFEIIGNDSKARELGFIWSRETLNADFSHMKCCLPGINERVFCIV